MNNNSSQPDVEQRELDLTKLEDLDLFLNSAKDVYEEAKALRKMRHPTRAKQLQAFLDLMEEE